MHSLSFDSLDETEFEAFCYDLLNEFGFINVDWRKGTELATSPSDRSRDIVCQWEHTESREDGPHEEAAPAQTDLIGIPERTVKEILAAEEELFDKIWYNRHLSWRAYVEAGPEKSSPKLWKLAEEAARRKEEKYDKEQLGPWSDFEWGMLNGKLSALRWVLGDEWDFLDT